MRNLKKNTHTLTEGSIWKGILLFALPLLGSSLIQQLYSTVDLIFVGQLLGTKASAAIGASGLIVTCLIGFFNGMAVGTNVFAARHYGAKRFNELKKLIQTIFWTGIIGGLLLMVIGLIFSPIFLTWMGTPKSIFPLAVRYLRIYMVSMISIVSYNLLSGVLRALGDSRTPLLYQFFGGIINVFADFIFLAVFHMGVEGTALATLFSQTVAAIGIMLHLLPYQTLSSSHRLIHLALQRLHLLQSTSVWNSSYICRLSHSVRLSYPLSGKITEPETGTELKKEINSASLAVL